MTWDATLAIAVLGAVLGIYNAARQWWRDIERLKVIPKSGQVAIGEAATQATLVIEVVNMSAFPVTLDEVGFLAKGSHGRLAIVGPIMLDRGTLPRRLEPRTSVTLCASPNQDFSFIANVTKAYATTATGRVFRGSSPRLRWMVKHGEVPTEARRLFGRPGIISHSGEPEA